MREHRAGAWTTTRYRLEGIVDTILPPEAHATAAQLEDAMTTWYTGTRPHARTRDAGERAVTLCGDLIVIFQQLRDKLTAEIGQYDDERRRGEV